MLFDLIIVKVITLESFILLNSSVTGVTDMVARDGRKNSLHQQLLSCHDVALHKISEKVLEVASSTNPVLIYGSSDKGRELVARSISLHSPRPLDSFLWINCINTQNELLQTQLFGLNAKRDNGSFSEHNGHLKLAPQGTIFIDHIEAIDQATQIMLLQVLESNTVDCPRSDEAIISDVRIIAATRSNPKQLLEKDNFIGDLLYKLNTHLIYIPPLRRKNDDTLLLASAINQKSNNESRSGTSKLFEKTRNNDEYFWADNAKNEKQSC